MVFHGFPWFPYSILGDVRVHDDPEAAAPFQEDTWRRRSHVRHVPWPGVKNHRSVKNTRHGIWENLVWQFLSEVSESLRASLRNFWASKFGTRIAGFTGGLRHLRLPLTEAVDEISGRYYSGAGFIDDHMEVSIVMGVPQLTGLSWKIHL